MLVSYYEVVELVPVSPCKRRSAYLPVSILRAGQDMTDRSAYRG
jgi:hypothetical protein